MHPTLITFADVTRINSHDGHSSNYINYTTPINPKKLLRLGITLHETKKRFGKKNNIRDNKKTKVPCPHVKNYIKLSKLKSMPNCLERFQ